MQLPLRSFVLLIFLALNVSFAEARDLRKFTFSSTSFDSGFVNIEVDDAQNAVVDWSWDPFRKPKPKIEQWKKELKSERELTSKFFAVLDSIGFSEVAAGPAQPPDAPSVTYSEFLGAKRIHSVTYPASDVPESLRQLDPALKAVYEKAKAQK